MPKPARVTKVHIRMYRAGTGDFFVLLFKAGNTVTFRMMIDCGCIKGGKETFKPLLKNLEQHAGKSFDLLVVTHQHADHINGFEKCADLFDELTFKKVWFAWTEDDTDPIANDYRANHSELGMAINTAAARLNKLATTKYYEKLFANEVGGNLMVQGRRHFIQSLASISALLPVSGLAATGQPLPTMVELFKDYKVIKSNTDVDCTLEPGDVKTKLPGAPGIRFYILGPPRDRAFLNRTEAEGESFEKREEKSTVDFSFLSAVGADPLAGRNADLPFDSKYEAKADEDIRKTYESEGDWRKIDHDWLYSAGSLAMRYERSINNTSLALAIQFEHSERVLLFPGDAELGNWESWHNELKWPVKINGQIVSKKADYFLEKTVFYKVGHHLSQNGTAKGKGIDLMTSPELTAMVTLDFRKINSGWLNTMPNDLLGAELIRKTKGKLYFVGDCKKILANIKTDRVTVKKEDENVLKSLNGQFDGEVFIDCEVEG
jgi:hypothetical protein